MADINLQPPFNGSVETTLNTRKDWVKTREQKWNYKRTAYFNLESVNGEGNSEDEKD